MTGARRVLDQYVGKPYYLFRPTQLGRRVWRALREPPESARVDLPWGVTLACSPREDIGRSLWTTGVYELAVTEVIWRLVDRGETTIDGGANIGYMTSVLASRVGPEGRVVAFEPHPEVYARLCANVDSWYRTRGWSQISMNSQALSSACGAAPLYTDAAVFKSNCGTASLTPRSADAVATAVSCTTLDVVMTDAGQVGLLKLDLEGHEYEALQGASRLLARGDIRDIVFESWSDDRRAIELLERSGYHVFRISRTLLKPQLESTCLLLSSPFEPTCYVATRDAARSHARLAPRGWRTLERHH